MAILNVTSFFVISGDNLFDIRVIYIFYIKLNYILRLSRLVVHKRYRKQPREKKLS